MCCVDCLADRSGAQLDKAPIASQALQRPLAGRPQAADRHTEAIGHRRIRASKPIDGQQSTDNSALMLGEISDRGPDCVADLAAYRSVLRSVRAPIVLHVGQHRP